MTVLAPAELDTLLAFLPHITALASEPAIAWQPDRFASTESGTTLTLRRPVYPEPISDFFTQVVTITRTLPAPTNARDVFALIRSDDLIAAASLNDILAALRHSARSERFCDGSWLTLIRGGRITALLTRLQTLRNELSDTPTIAPIVPPPTSSGGLR